MATNPDDDVNTSIARCLELREDAKALLPRLESLAADVKAQSVPYKTHEVTIDSVSKELDEVTDSTSKLEGEISFHTKVYERLRSIVMSLTVDQDNLQILETGSFTNTDDLVEIEKELEMVTEFTRGKSELSIVKERALEVQELISNFLKRFLMFLSKLQVKSESKGELRVHKEFYKTMSQYKFIYKFGKNNADYYSALCIAYFRKAKNLYSEEFKHHLNDLTQIVTNSISLKHACIALFASYELLLTCESNFLESMTMDSDCEEIFSNVDMMIIDFLALFFKRFPHYVMYVLSVYSMKEKADKLGGLGSKVQKQRDDFEVVFVHQQKAAKLDIDTIKLINGLAELPARTDLLEKLTKMSLEKASQDGGAPADEQLYSLQALLGIDSPDEATLKCIKEVENQLVEKIIGKVFGAKDEKKEIEALFKVLDPDLVGYEPAAEFTKKTILENCEESRRDIFMRMVADALKPKT